MTRLGLARMLFRTVLFVAIAVYLCWRTHLLAGAGVPSRAPVWMPEARGILAIVVIVIFLLPFYLERVFGGIAAPHFQARGKKPEEVILRVAIVLYGSSPIFAFVLGRSFDVYATSVVCVSGIAFWSWRYRRLFRLQGAEL